MMNTCLIFLAIAATVLGNPAKINGGTEVMRGEIPFQVSIRDDNGNHTCGGVIIGNDIVLTVASCAGNLGIGQSRVISGIINLNDAGLEHRIQKMTLHPNFTIESESNLPHYDVAVLKVSPSFPADEVTGRAFMPIQGYQIPDGTVCTLSGWGETSFGGGVISDVLLKTDVPTISDADCAEAYADHSDIFTIDPEMICAGVPEGGKDGCTGDAGGPLFLDGVVYGIFIVGGHCGAPGRPGVYVEVSAFRDWIDENSM